MNKILELSREQARLLYNLVSQHNVPNRSDNRKRFKFLEVIENFVFKFEDELQALKGTQVEVRREATELGKVKKRFTFKDIEVFAQAKDIFEKTFERGTKIRDAMGRTIESPLVGRDAKVYVELEDAFMDVKEVKVNDKQKK